MLNDGFFKKKINVKKRIKKNVSHANPFNLNLNLILILILILLNSVTSNARAMVIDLSKRK
jgi:hypothetical protein